MAMSQNTVVLLFPLLLLLGLSSTASANVCSDLDREPPFCAGEPLPCEGLCLMDCVMVPGCSSPSLFECLGTPTFRCDEKKSSWDCSAIKGCEWYGALPCESDQYRNCPRCQSLNSIPPPTLPPTLPPRSHSVPPPTLPQMLPQAARPVAAPPPGNDEDVSPPLSPGPDQVSTPAPPAVFTAASPTNFCYNLDGNPPYCYGQAKPCSELDWNQCDFVEGCSSDMTFEGLFDQIVNGAQCSGTNAKTCSERDFLTCLNQPGCQIDSDPPCDRDPFDVAILPLDPDTVVCGAGGTLAAQRGSCAKTRPSRDGETTFGFVVAVGGCQNSVADPDCVTFSGCSVSIDGRDCQSCSMCGSGFLDASFNCANVLSLARVEGDERCPEGTRCVGRDCAGECICGIAGRRGNVRSAAALERDAGWVFFVTSALVAAVVTVAGM